MADGAIQLRERMTAALINPNLIVQRNDRFTTGIVYMPIGLAYVAASLRGAGIDVRVIDAFGEDPRRSRREGAFSVLGLTPEEVVDRLPDTTSVAFIYANQLLNHASLASLVQAVKARHPQLPVVVLENTQAVTAYQLLPVADELFKCGADYLLSGEAEIAAIDTYRALQDPTHEQARHVAGLSARTFRNPTRPFNDDLDALPMPAWDLFPVENYWSLHFAHGPLSSGRYLPLLTSRGCPYPCTFCVVPATNALTWRPRSAANVVDEMEQLSRRFGVREFHIEDLNPTIQDRRTRQICQEIIQRKLKVVWKLVAGTKVETMRNKETIDLMAQAGCRYISISPESGSPRMLKLIDKPFKADHAVKLIKRMHQVGIRSQACFVLGFPDEQDADREMTRTMVRDFTRVGVDEIALFIIAPVPGSKIFGTMSGYTSLSELNFTPTWRADYAALNRFRLRLYLSFLLWKIRYHPLTVARQCLNFLARRFETKMEMVPYRALIFRLLDLRSKPGLPAPARISHA